MEKLVFTRACLSSVRVIMAIYACTLGRVAMPSGDGMNSCTRVPTAKHMWGLWPCPVVPGGKCCRFPRPQRLVKSMRYSKILDGVVGRLGPSWVKEGVGSGRQVAKSCLPTSTVMRRRDDADCSYVQFFLGWGPVLFSQEWWGHIRYGVYGSLAICCWRLPVVSRILGLNRQPVVHGVLDPDNLSTSPVDYYDWEDAMNDILWDSGLKFCMKIFFAYRTFYEQVLKW
jgi:hypothetical protein